MQTGSLSTNGAHFWANPSSTFGRFVRPPRAHPAAADPTTLRRAIGYVQDRSRSHCAIQIFDAIQGWTTFTADGDNLQWQEPGGPSGQAQATSAFCIGQVSQAQRVSDLPPVDKSRRATTTLLARRLVFEEAEFLGEHFEVYPPEAKFSEAYA